MKVVFDTNILVSAFITGGGREYDLLEDTFKGKIDAVISEDILDEFSKVMSRPKFGYNKKQVADMRFLLIGKLEVVMPKENINTIEEDPQDNRILECAVEAKADYIITGDQHLLKLKKYKKIRIINSTQFLEKK